MVPVSSNLAFKAMQPPFHLEVTSTLRWLTRYPSKPATSAQLPGGQALDGAARSDQHPKSVHTWAVGPARGSEGAVTGGCDVALDASLGLLPRRNCPPSHGSFSDLLPVYASPDGPPHKGSRLARCLLPCPASPKQIKDHRSEPPRSHNYCQAKAPFQQLSPTYVILRDSDTILMCNFHLMSLFGLLMN